MQIVPSKQSSPMQREFVDLIRDPLVLATAASLGFEAIAHLFTILFIVLVSSVVGSLAVLALRGAERYPILHRFVFTKARRP